jgi:phospholipid/cholesterol/gamma-HCH transport system substrate-binding protein
MKRLAGIGAILVVAAIALTGLVAGSSRGAGGSYEVRAIFDDASFAVQGEEVRIAGAPVGSIESLGVTPDKRAAVTLAVDNSDFTPFYANATCAIRPQSLIGEEYVDCNPGTSTAPPLKRIARGPGAGTYLLPVTRTTSPVDFDIVQDIYQQPVRQQLSILIDELGTGLAARGSDLNAVIHRADPALGYTDQVIQILARQNRALAQLASDSDAVLTPLARERQSLSDFVVQANRTSVASAARAADIARSFQLFPSFLRQLQPLMTDLGSLADQGTPLLSELGASASGLAQEFTNLTPFAQAARPALIALGAASKQSQPALVATIPLARQLQSLGQQGAPAAASLDRLTASLNRTGGIQQLMKLLFFGTTASNGFDSFGHYVREQLLVNSCTSYSTSPITGCSSNFQTAGAAADSASVPKAEPAAPRTDGLVAKAVRSAAARQPRTGQLSGLLRYLIGKGI